MLLVKLLVFRFVKLENVRIYDLKQEGGGGELFIRDF